MRPMLDSVTSKELLESLERHKQMIDETIGPFWDSFASSGLLETLERHQQMADEIMKPSRNSLASSELLETLERYQQMADETIRPFLDSLASSGLLDSLERLQQMADETIRPFKDSLTSAEKLCKLIESVNRSMGGANQQNLGETVTESAEAQFTVYVNHPTSTVTIHSTACYYFRNRIADETPNGHWEKPLSCVEDAWKHAMAENKRTKRYCGTCLPGYQS